MRTSQYEEEYDQLFDADNRNPEALEETAYELDFIFNNRHKDSDFGFILQWFNNNWISNKEFERLRGIYGNF